MKKVFFTLAVLLLFVASSALGFDNVRKGFMLDFGVGPGLTSFTQTLEVGGLSVKSDRENKFGLLTNFKIGVGLNEQTQLYWVSKVSWFSLDNALGSSVTIANGVGGIGVSHFFELMAPSPYVFGGVGFSTWSAPFESGSSTWIGFGATGGFGYEFSPHWGVEGTITYGNPGDTEFGIDVKSDAISFGATVNYMAY